jgi:predicted RNA-binding protein associated with RNAse of E/G family
VEILEVKRTLAGGVQTYPCTAVNITPGRAVIRYQSAAPRRIADVDLPAGTVTFAYYWADRPYNVYHWLDPHGQTLAYYFNLSSPAQIASDRVIWEDLEVDVLVTPDRRVQVLDEDRLPAALAAQRRAEIAAAQARVLADQTAVVAEIESASRALGGRATWGP